MGRSPAEYEAFQDSKKRFRTFARRFAWLGAGFVMIVVWVAIAHFVFGTKVYFGRAGVRLATDAEIIGTLALFGFGGLVFLTLGLLFGYGKKR